MYIHDDRLFLNKTYFKNNYLDEISILYSCYLKKNASFFILMRRNFSRCAFKQLKFEATAKSKPEAFTE